MTEIQVDYIDHCGSDLTIVNAARVSHKKRTDWVCQDQDSQSYCLSQRDESLIAFLEKHNNFTPFTHCFATFRIKAPVFVRAQLLKSTVGLSYTDVDFLGDLSINEVSRRYVADEPEFYNPKVWRGRAEDIKQGSAGTVKLSHGWPSFSDAQGMALEVYESLLEKGVAPEQARMVLPQSLMTEWYWSGSLAGFARVCLLRLEETAQEECQQVAKEISNGMNLAFPTSWHYLVIQHLEMKS